MDEKYILTTFESIGIPKMQTLVYLDLLKHKASTATEVSKRTRMHRANVYDTLTKLKERNLIYVSPLGEKQVFAALPTDLIINNEKDRLENLKLAMDYIKTIYVPEQIPRVYTLEGLRPVKSILFSLLEKKTDACWIYGLAKDENMMNLLKDKLMNSFQIERIKKHLSLKLLFYKLPPEGELKSLSKLKFTEARLLPKSQQAKISKITQIVCGNYVYVTLWVDPICTIVIENEIIAKEYATLYEILWDHSKRLE
ncbi:hypothetical protein K0A97_01035 [Patescibacteria group bacterium]|nr:hypothetical protein [Patescibacteria group bacterium]